jgi:hypothetical protein
VTARKLTVYRSGTLGGPRTLLAVEQARAIQAGKDEQIFHATVQKIEAEADRWQAWSQQEEIVAKGMGAYYAGGAAALADLLTDLEAFTRGSESRIRIQGPQK